LTTERAIIPFDPNRAIQKVDDSQVKALADAPVWPRDCNENQRVMVARLAIAYGLDPMMGELTVFQGKPWITIDGRIRLASESGKYQGIVEDRPATDAEYTALRCNPDEVYLWYVSVKHADWIKPVGRFGRVKLKGDRNAMAGVDKAIPVDVMARKRALWSALREAWPLKLPGIYEDEHISTREPMAEADTAQMESSKGQIAAIHALVTALEWTEERYRGLLQERFGAQVTSSTLLTSFQAQDLLDELTELVERKQRQDADPQAMETVGDVFGDFEGETEQPEPERPADPPHAVYTDGKIVSSDKLPTVFEAHSQHIREATTPEALRKVASEIKLDLTLTPEQREQLREEWANQKHVVENGE